MVRIDVIAVLWLAAPVKALAYPAYFVASVMTGFDEATLHYEAAVVYAELAAYLLALHLGRRAYLSCRRDLHFGAE